MGCHQTLRKSPMGFSQTVPKRFVWPGSVNIGKGVRLATHKSHVSLPAILLSGNHCRQVFTYMCLCHQSVWFSTNQRAAVSCSWEGNHRSGITFSVCQKLEWSIHIRAQNLITPTVERWVPCRHSLLLLLLRPVKNWVVGIWHGYLSGVKCRLACSPADATATHCLFSKIQIGFTFLVPADPGSPGQRAIKRVCVYCYSCFLFLFNQPCYLSRSRDVVLFVRWPQHRHEIRRRPMEEREKNPREQTQRMKQSHEELGIWQLQRRRTILFYVVRITLVTLMAVGGYGLFYFFWR